jgi:hypothetical protein
VIGTLPHTRIATVKEATMFNIHESPTLNDRFANEVKAAVLASGWVMHDPEFPDELGKTRGTHSEIRPLTRVEYWTGTEWKDL